MNASRVRATLVAFAAGALLFSTPLQAQTGSAIPLGEPKSSQTEQGTVSDPQSPSRSADSPVVGVERPGRPLRPALRELSPWSMFLSADFLVQLVMISLAFASLVTWTIFLAMSAKILLARRGLRQALTQISRSRTISEAQIALGGNRTVLSAFLRSALEELRMSAEVAADARIEQRVASRFSEIARDEARMVRRGMGLLATIGATAPFVGLFGTVWGIMNSFIGISKAQTTNLAIVAPGIAEALLATAIGLITAIPAVMIYNYFSRSTKGYLELVGRASGAVGRMLSRDLDGTQSDATLARAAE